MKLKANSGWSVQVLESFSGNISKGLDNVLMSGIAKEYKILIGATGLIVKLRAMVVLKHQ